MKLTTRWLLLVLLLLTGCTTIPQAAPSTVETTPTPDDASAAAQPVATATPETAAMPAQEASVEESPADADVLFVKATLSSNGSWRFDVTVAHPDTGWGDYADGWDVVLSDGTVLKNNADDPFTRLLLHPHETEQPFTRSQSGLQIPVGETSVLVRAHDLVDGWGGVEVVVDLNQTSGENFEVVR